MESTVRAARRQVFTILSFGVKSGDIESSGDEPLGATFISIRTLVHRRRKGGYPPPPLPPFQCLKLTAKFFASAPSTPGGFTLQNFRPAFGGDHRGTPGGGGSQPNPPFPPLPPPSNTFLPPTPNTRSTAALRPSSRAILHAVLHPSAQQNAQHNEGLDRSMRWLYGSPLHRGLLSPYLLMTPAGTS